MELAGRGKAKVLGRDERQAEPAPVTRNELQKATFIKVRYPPPGLGEVYLVRQPYDDSEDFQRVSAQSRNAPPVQNGLFAVFQDSSSTLAVFQEAVGKVLYDNFFGSNYSIVSPYINYMVLGMNQVNGGHENALHDQLSAWFLEPAEDSEQNVFQFVTDYGLQPSALSVTDEGRLKIVAKPSPSHKRYKRSLFMVIPQDGLSMAPQSNL